MPTVAVFQTDLCAFAGRYGFGMSTPLLWAWLRRLHNSADLTLAPSSATAYQLRRHGIGTVFRVAADQGLAAAAIDESVLMM